MSKKDWMFTNQSLTVAYNYTEKYYKQNKSSLPAKRTVVARLLFGEWVKPLSDKNGVPLTAEGQSYVAFRGGVGWIPTDSIGTERTLEIYFLDVGQGDAILIQTPQDNRYLIDGGPTHDEGELAHEFLKWKFNLEGNQIDFDAVIMSHADRDHAMGLVPIVGDQKIKIKKFYHNGISRFRGKPSDGKIMGKNPRRLVEIFDDITKLDFSKISGDYQKLFTALTKAKKKNRDIKIEHLDHTSVIKKLPNDPLEIEILGPINISQNDRVEYLASGTADKMRNGNSVSLMAKYGKCKILLCGDMNTKYEKEFIKFHKDYPLESHVFKANHHGSQDVTTEFLERVRPWISIVSSGDVPDHAHPRAELLGILGKYSSQDIKRPIIFATEILRTYHPVSSEDIEEVKKRKREYSLYERAIDGIVHVRTDGKKLVVGRVYGDPTLTSAKNNPSRTRNQNAYKWEYYEFDL
ncbi:MAG: MBL fold metallo-hydrolase [Nitrosopumilus sp.]|uniref:ComEC/Rec2 family competence protein n=1 Tax=Nitrosopumilus sp. TaxID=2024843 RepID=UPI00242AC054|nr:MBL fold metallo-hydrolase [Nitrosopumilus sp.]MCV0367251.1 MBL fold metallo-hydrolase [Nitrosopumilus sp.]